MPTLAKPCYNVELTVSVNGEKKSRKMTVAKFAFGVEALEYQRGVKTDLFELNGDVIRILKVTVVRYGRVVK